MSKIKVALIESNPVWRETLLHTLQIEPDLEVVETAASKEQGQQLIIQKQFDVVLLNLMLVPDIHDGLDLANEAIKENAKMLLMASESDSEWVGNAIQAGVMNIVLKSCYEQLPTAIREVYLGHDFIHPHTLQMLRHEIIRLKIIEGEWMLTRSEREILELIGQGYSRKQIMAYLHVSESAVKNHVFHAIKKMKVKSGKDAAAMAKRKGWIS